MRNKYPGTKPFQTDEQDIFFGRRREINLMLQQLQRHNQLVLYGKSGMGKTSLINAGVIPALRYAAVDRGVPPPDIIQIRLGRWQLDELSLQEKINAYFPRTPSLLDQFENHDSLWCRLKSRQIYQGEATQFILFFDQFEEALRDGKIINDTVIDLAFLRSQGILGRYEYKRQVSKDNGIIYYRHTT